MNSWTSESTHPPWKHILDRLTGSRRSPEFTFLVVFEETEAVPHSHKPSLLLSAYPGLFLLILVFYAKINFVYLMVVTQPQMPFL